MAHNVSGRESLPALTLIGGVSIMVGGCRTTYSIKGGSDARQAAISRRLDDDAMISSILQDADVTHELVVAAQARAHVLWLANYLRDQDAPYDAAATEKVARENILAAITDYLRELTSSGAILKLLLSSIGTPWAGTMNG